MSDDAIYDDCEARDVLRAGGFQITHEWAIAHPQDRAPTEHEWAAISCLVWEWDYLGLVTWAVAETHVKKTYTPNASTVSLSDLLDEDRS